MDQYIDLEELTRYSDHFLAAVKPFVGLHPAVETVIADQEEARKRVADLIARTQDTRSGLGMSQKNRRDLDEEVSTKLEEHYDLLYAKRKTGSFDLNRFYPTGTRDDFGRNIADRKAALERVLAGLKQYPQSPEADVWLATFTELQDEYDPTVDANSTLDTNKRAATKELQTVRTAWSRSYWATKLIMKGLLVRVGREDEYKGLFKDLQQGTPAPEEVGPKEDADAAGESESD